MRQHQAVILDLNTDGTVVTESERGSQYIRVTQERRTFSIKAAWYSIIMGRRKESRREINTPSEHVVDSHEQWLLFLVFGVIALSVTDSCMTILLMSNGATEANPIMAVLIESSLSLFFWVKLILTCMSMMILLILKNFSLFKYINSYHIITMALLGYMYLFSYQLNMLDLMI